MCFSHTRRADTLAAIQLARSRGCLGLGMCNAVGSTIARETDAGIYLHAGPEIGVASTKAFSAQLVILCLFALKVARERGAIDAAELGARMEAMRALPELLRTVLAQREEIKKMSHAFR